MPFLVLVNPVVARLGDERETGWEGCLSIPDLRGVVPRLQAAEARGPRPGTASPTPSRRQDFFARVIQHECDHLDGDVYVDRMADLRSLTFIKEFEDHVHQDGE